MSHAPTTEVEATAGLDQIHLRPDPQRKHVTCLRIGNYPILDDEIRDPSPQDKRTAGREDAPAYSWPLLVWFDDAFKTVTFSRVRAYEFDDFCIGNIHEDSAWNSVKFDSSYHYLGPFAHVRWKGESRATFIKRLKKHVEDGLGPVATGLPFLPSLCLDTFKAEDFGLGLERWPKQGVDVVVRDIRLVIRKEHDLRAIILDEMKVNEVQDDVEVTSARLFEPRHRANWELELWVMPQTGPRRLYLYERGELIQFLDPSENVRTRDKGLYLEVYVVQKR